MGLKIGRNPRKRETYRIPKKKSVERHLLWDKVHLFRRPCLYWRVDFAAMTGLLGFLGTSCVTEVAPVIVNGAGNSGNMERKEHPHASAR